MLAKKPRRIIAACLMALGALLLWFAPQESLIGVVLLVLGVVTELVGIALEKRRLPGE